LGTITVTAAAMERLAMRVTTREWPISEKPSPPNSSGITMPKNRSRLRKSHTSGAIAILLDLPVIEHRA
jgi:hypothetical protein